MDNVFGLWLAGACLSGFFFLALWIRGVDAYSNKRDTELQSGIDKKVSYKECRMKEKIVDEKLTAAIAKLSAQIDKLCDALLGTLERKGMVTIQMEHGERIEKLEKELDKKIGDIHG